MNNKSGGAPLRHKREREMADGVGKRKAEVKKRLIMFMNSWLGDKSAAIFEIPIELTTSGMSVDDDDDRVVILLDWFYKGQVLQPIKTFYDRHETHAGIRSVGACVSGSELYMFPDKGGFKESSTMNMFIRKWGMLNPSVYDLTEKPKKENRFLYRPEAMKMGAIVTIVGRELFALSAYSECKYQSPMPGFEALDLDKHTWRELALSPIHKTRLSSKVCFEVTGYAVLGADFLLLSVNKIQPVHAGVIFFYTYSFQSNLWKDTNSPSFMDDTPLMYGQQPYLSKQALVVGYDIYTFHPVTLELAVFSYSKYTGVAGYDVELSPLTVVRGLAFDQDDIPSYWNAPAPLSTAIAQVEDGILCLLHMVYPAGTETQTIHVSFIQLQGRDLCKKIESFRCDLQSGPELDGLLFSSCYILPDDGDEEQDQQPGKRAHWENDNKAAAIDCGIS